MPGHARVREADLEFADEACRSKDEADCPVLILTQAPLDEARPEAAPLRLLHTWSARFRPPQAKQRGCGCLGRPLDTDAAVRTGQRAVFHRVGGELLQRHG